MNNPGIDYSVGQANHDTKYHYGVVSQNNILQAWCEKSEPYYGEGECPDCGQTIDTDNLPDTCPNCGADLEGMLDFAEPVSWSVVREDLVAETCLDNDVMIGLSPYWCYAPFCSPCCPGAGDIDNSPMPNEGETIPEYKARMDAVGYPRCYCPPPDWFDEPGDAPYMFFAE